MGSFYEIIKKLKTEPEKRKFKKKKLYSKKPIFLLVFLFLIVGSGLVLTYFVSYIKKSPKPIYISKKEYTLSQNISKKEDISSQKEPFIKSNVYVSLPSQKPSSPKLPVSLSPKTSSLTNINKPEPEITSEKLNPDEKAEQPIEGFILNREDLLNNFLILAEEERKKGNCKEAVFYYKNYLKEKENPFVMNNYGACLLELGKLEEAINVFKKALSLKNDSEIRYNLILAYLKKGEKEKACNEIKSLSSDSFLKEKIENLKDLCR